jgi:hypothetical protein
MKKLVTVISVLALLLVFTSAASAARPVVSTFTIAGHNTSSPVPEPLPSGLIKFHLTAEGDVVGDFQGTFDFEEWGIANPGSAQGVNHGILTLTTTEGKTITIRFDGKTDFVNVWGNFRVLPDGGDPAGIHGEGTYAGDTGVTDPGGNFTVTFTGRFH